MAQQLIPGIKGKSTITVNEKDTALAHGSGNVPVFATPAMIALMENSAYLSVLPYLKEGFITVGTEISVKHVRPSAIGTTVTSISKLTDLDGNKLNFTLTVEDERGIIGYGTHTRYMMTEETFMKGV